MTIPNISDEFLRKVLAENLTPSDTIKTPERLFGRERNLRTIDRALNSPGRQIFIFGDRGVGNIGVPICARGEPADPGDVREDQQLRGGHAGNR